MDEPTKGMDPFFKEEFAGIVSELKSEGKTILTVSHDIEFCAKYVDRVGMMFDGQLNCVVALRVMHESKNACVRM